MESKKRIEDANLERDRIMLKEQQHLTRISNLEIQLRQDGQERQERHDRVMTNLRAKHKSQIEQKVDEIAEINRKLSDAHDKAERARLECESKQTELNKLHEQLRTFKDDTSTKYESYNKQLNQQESMAESKVSQLRRENERLKDTADDLLQQSQKG